LAAYLVVGADELKRRTAVTRLKARLDPGLVDFNLDELTVKADTDPQEVISSLQTLPFGAGFRLVIIQEADHLPKPVSDAIVSYLEDPNPDSVLLIAATTLPKTTRLRKAIQKLGPTAVIDCTPRKRYELPRMVVEMATAYGKGMDQRAADELVSRVGESTVMLDAQVKSLASLVGDSPRITYDDVRSRVARIAEPKPWDFLDAVCERDAAKAMGLYGLMPGASVVGLHSFLTTRLRELICAKALDERGQAALVPSALSRPQWQVKNHVRWARGFSMDELVSDLKGAAACERILKGSGDSDIAFRTWVLSIVTR
jgi:DNA polymerase-3 subunit delta